jgi:hypothetical protein
MKNYTKQTLKTLSTLLTVTLLVALPRNVALADDASNPKVLPPNSHPYGRTYGEWSAAWWKWNMELPVTGPIPHPSVDDPAFDVTFGQQGKVWFLAAPFGTVVRNCTIPHGKALFVGLLNAEASDLEGLGNTKQERKDTAKFLADHIVVSSLSCTMDGEPVKHIERYRVVSPQFTFTAPTPWLFGAVGGTGKSVGDGYYVMLAPLSAGQHTLHYSGAFHFSVAEGDPFDWDGPLDMTYKLTVQGKPAGQHGDSDDDED